MNKKFREQFPILKKIIYLDSGALVQKPISVIQANQEYYEKFAISSHSPDSLLGIEAIKNIKNTRKKIAKFINAKSDEIIFTSGTTHGINILALMISKILKKNDEIILSKYNHSSNMVPWIEMAKTIEIKVFFIENDSEKNILKAINKNTKLLAINQVNNTILKKKNFQNIYKICKKNNIFLINDAAQAIIIEKIDLENEADAVVFSSNKMFGPTGIGVLAIKKKLLDKLEPAYYGGGATISMNGLEWKKHKGPEAFEPGTPNLAGIYQFNKAIDFVNKYITNEAKQYLKNLGIYLHQKLKTLNDIDIISNENDYIAIFRYKKYGAQDVVSYLGHNNIYVRSGDFCAKNLKILKKNNGYIRVSLSYYNNKEDIDKLIEALKKEDFFGFL